MLRSVRLAAPVAVAVLTVAAAASAAFAIDTPLPNGSFEGNNPAGGFTQTINNWTVSFSGTAGGSLPANQFSGLFTSYAKFNTPPAGQTFALLTNLGGGTVTLTSGAVGTNFAVIDRLLQFNYAYMTNDAPSAGTHDAFRVHIDFYATATSTSSIGSIDRTIANQATDINSSAGLSPFGGAFNSPLATYNNAIGTNFNLISLDVSQFFNSFARVSFIVDNAGPAAGTNGNGLGVSGIVLDNVVLNPEPGTIALFGLGLAGLGGFAWRRRSAKKPLA